MTKSTDAKVAEYVDRIVSEAPALTAEQRDIIARSLAPAVSGSDPLVVRL